MYLKAYAKINLGLNVLGKKEDGYHTLDMVVLPIKLHDTVVVSKISKKRDSYILINDERPSYNNNFCEKLIHDIEHKYNIKKRYEFAIYKEIPIEAGLGGGSSDAASIAKFYNKKFKLKLSDLDLINLTKPYGSDIPFFIINKPARVRGCGEIIEPIKIKSDYYVLIVKPKTGLSTKEIYNSLTNDVVKVADIDNLIKALENGDNELLLKSIGNALEEPAINKCNKIQEIKDYLKSQGFPITLMSGSGTSVFALSNDLVKIKEVTDNLKKLNYKAFYTTIIKE